MTASEGLIPDVGVVPSMPKANGRQTSSPSRPQNLPGGIGARLRVEARGQGRRRPSSPAAERIGEWRECAGECVLCSLLSRQIMFWRLKQKCRT